MNILDAINKQTEEEIKKKPIKEEKIENEEKMEESFKITQEKIEATYKMLEIEENDEEDEFISRARREKKRKAREEEQKKKENSSYSKYGNNYHYGYRKEPSEDEKKKLEEKKKRQYRKKVLKAKIKKVLREERNKPFDIFDAHRNYDMRKKEAEYIKGINHTSVKKEIAKTKNKLKLGVAILNSFTKLFAGERREVKKDEKTDKRNR